MVHMDGKLPSSRGKQMDCPTVLGPARYTVAPATCPSGSL